MSGVSPEQMQRRRSSALSCGAERRRSSLQSLRRLSTAPAAPAEDPSQQAAAAKRLSLLALGNQGSSVPVNHGSSSNVERQHHTWTDKVLQRPAPKPVVRDLLTELSESLLAQPRVRNSPRFPWDLETPRLADGGDDAAKEAPLEPLVEPELPPEERQAEMVKKAASYIPYVLTASVDRTAMLWDVATGACIDMFGERRARDDEEFGQEGHGGPVNSAVVCPEGLFVLTASDDHTAILWSLESAQEVKRFEGHEGAVRSAAFSTDGTRVLTASHDGSVKLWDPKTGGCTETLRYHEGPVSSATFTPDGCVLSSSHDGTARLWCLQSSECKQVFRGHVDSVRAAVSSADGAWVLTASSDRTAKLWDATSGKCRQTFQGHKGCVESVAFWPGGRAPGAHSS